MWELWAYSHSAIETYAAHPPRPNLILISVLAEQGPHKVRVPHSVNVPSVISVENAIFLSLPI